MRGDTCSDSHIKHPLTYITGTRGFYIQCSIYSDLYIYRLCGFGSNVLDPLISASFVFRQFRIYLSLLDRHSLPSSRVISLLFLVPNKFKKLPLEIYPYYLFSFDALKKKTNFISNFEKLNNK